MDKDAIIHNIIQQCHIFYDNEYPKLFKIGKNHKTEGEIRAAAGNFIEKFLQKIFDCINTNFPTAKIESKVGTTDFLSLSIQYKGKTYTNDEIQVDRHVYSNGRPIAFIENKTYLDSCYYDRALADFKKIIYAIKQNSIDPSNCKYIVFAGQLAASKDKLLFYEAEFHNEIKHLTTKEKGVDTKIFFFFKGKRSSKRPLYKVKHELDDDVLYTFISYILDILKI